MENESLRALMEQGFANLNQRMDEQRELSQSRHSENVGRLTTIEGETRRINGQIATAHEKIASHAEQFRALFSRRRTDATARDVAKEEADVKLSDLKWYLVCAGGGAGLVQGNKALSFEGNFTTSGAFASTFTMTGTTGVTFPTSGTLATLAGAEAFTNKSGNISQWTNDASYTTLSAVAGVGYLTSVTAHNLLSATHGDTLTDAVVRGDILYANSTPKWARLPKPSVLSGLSHDGTDVSWVTATGTGAPVRATSATLVTPALGTPTAGVLSSCTGLPLTTGVTGVLPTANGGTGIAYFTAAGPTTARVYTFPDAATTIVGLDTTQTLTNKRITKRVVTASDATSITPNSDSADLTTQTNTQAVGTLTINADAGTPTNGQSWLLKIKSSNIQTFAWNAIFEGGTVALPTATTGSSKIDLYAFIYDSIGPHWIFTGAVLGCA